VHVVCQELVDCLPKFAYPVSDDFVGWVLFIAYFLCQNNKLAALIFIFYSY